MEQHTPTPAYDHISICNRAREMRAELIAERSRVFAGWVALRWAELTHRKAHQPA